MISRVLAVVAAVLVAAGAQAQCPDPANLVANCGFETTDDGWNAVRADTMTRTTAQARTGVASLYGDSQQMPADWRLTVETCVDVSPGTDYRSGAFLRLASGAAPECRIYINAFSDDGCGTFALGNPGSWAAVSSAGWTLARYDFDSGVGIESVLLDVECLSEVADFDAWVDDAFLGTAVELPVFADGFESGGTTAWSL